MNCLERDINRAINMKCASGCGGNTEYNHSISTKYVLDVIAKLKHAKRDGSCELLSDHLLYIYHLFAS